MDHAYLKPEHVALREALRQFLEQEAVPYFSAWEKEQRVPRSFWRKLGAQGFLCPMVDERYGGAGADFGSAVVITEELERVGSGLLGIGLHNDIVVPYLVQYGSSAQKARWLSGCVRGDTITALAMTEPEAGSDLAAMRTRAVRDGDTYVISGQKTFITNGGQADLIVVAVKTDVAARPPHRGISLIVVENGAPGFSRGRVFSKIGQHSQDTAELFFDHCRVPAENLLGREGEGFLYLTEKLRQERVMVAIAAQASMERSLEITRDYVKARVQFGHPLSSLQSVRFTMAELATRVRVSRAFVDAAIVHHMAGRMSVSEASMAKLWATDTAKAVISECLQLHGGNGYMEDFEIARRYRDIAVMPIYAGTNEIMKTIIAKELLDEMPR
ncbi:MAG: acyl-CoA dehydrogenase [Sulfobacillus acidophilus]|uniref:Acyl-CoA dehydrogenase n=1 Tax=Sulfobacillus acidophilus TaxID=53633 RepID=A0A2T2WGI5_9FIRM|nr:MAG: acyl-CoA dehydrogenase [Sulfobacillus acidophilus]